MAHYNIVLLTYLLTYIDSYTPAIRTTLLIFRTQVFLNYDSMQRADDIFCSDTAILKISDCC